ncbi:hypothetical protein DSC45_12055 [Streptomyces sp. YIM 130001]|uniref:hypothetical protein n=1 Tax=Streptomyces sp. YIM 130001 TaxID=2259644 RepID=UPI000E64D72F|nr:hypothetical protein [Streptomyces sp. YIM 130001]RII17625.1 hypothetical protein DSC45_12055 [Streptomyces sp. YIM 130001]
MGGRQVREARQLLTGALDGRPAAELPGAAHDAVARLGAPARLVALLRELAAGAGDPAGCARLSYRHVLGFDKLLLFDGGPQHMLRAHVWHPRGRRGAPEDIHNHRSALASQVVRGSLGMELYEETDGTTEPPAGTGSDGGLTTVRYQESLAEGGDWLLAERGRAQLRLTHVARYAAGSGYALAPHALHRAWCSADEPTVTLFLEAGTHRRPHTDVFSGPGRRETATAKHPLPVEDYLSELTALARLVEG